MRTTLFIVFFISLIPIASFAQVANREYYNHEFVIGGNYDKPLGNLSWVYKPALGVQLGFYWVDEFRNENKITKNGINFSYFQLAPKADTLYYLVPPNSYGTAVYSNYKVTRASFHHEINKRLKDFRFIMAWDAGLAFISYSSLHKDKNLNLGEDSFEGKFFFAPQIGMGYSVTKNIMVSLNAYYNGLISLGSTDSNSADYNSNAGTYTHYTSFSLIAGYSF